VGLAKGEVMVMTDANTEFERDAIPPLVQPLRDDEVGLVCGRLRLHSPAGAPVTESAYWKLESLLKLYGIAPRLRDGRQRRIYAVRKLLFPPCRQARWSTTSSPPCASSPRVEGPLRARGGGARGDRSRPHRRVPPAGPDRGRLLQGAVAPSGAAVAASRLHGLRALVAQGPALVRPARHGGGADLDIFLARDGTFYSLAMLAQGGAYTLAALSLLGLTPRHVRAVADAAAHFVEMNAALLVGFVKYSRGAQGQTWVRTERPARAA